MKLLKPCFKPQKIVTINADKGSAIASVMLIVLKVFPTPLLVSFDRSTIRGISNLSIISIYRRLTQTIG